MNNIPDCPVIKMAERTGYGYPIEENVLTCPHCGESLYPDDTVYKLNGEVIACEYCFNEDEYDPNEIDECEAENEL